VGIHAVPGIEKSEVEILSVSVMSFDIFSITADGIAYENRFPKTNSVWEVNLMLKVLFQVQETGHVALNVYFIVDIALTKGKLVQILVLEIGIVKRYPKTGRFLAEMQNASGG